MSFSFAALTIVAAYAFLKIAEHFIKHEKSEPAVVWPRIPFFGHLIGMLQDGNAYYTTLSNRCKKPIFTVPFMHTKFYIVNSPAMISLVQRNSKTLIGDFFFLEFLDRLSNPDKDTMNAMKYGWDSLDEEAREKNIWTPVDKAQHAILGYGTHLDDLTVVQLNAVSELITSIPNGSCLNLFSWIRETITTTNMYSIFGRNNIFASSPELKERWREYDEGLEMLIAKVYPSITARKAYNARQELQDALVEWVNRGHHHQASLVVRENIRILNERGVPLEECAKMQLLMMFAALMNTNPTSFWTIQYLYSHPEILEKFREELQSSNAIRMDGNIGIISVNGLRKECPLIISILKEVLRTIAPSLTCRYVLEDTWLSNDILFKKGHLVRLEGAAVHKDPDVWGPDVHEFNPYRFYKSGNGTINTADEEPPKQVHPASFRGFGGGKGICPGRLFAQGEIIGISAMLALSFDLVPAEGGDILPTPLRQKSMLQLSVHNPKVDIPVFFRRRKGMENIIWKFEA
ncbi:cytochrome P450 [Microthyrium microscopicum]|uniref:Cytochrome P450 n=1 Tax=Microthyrium microscopicum TaxID=703497 RepID=A0A6A6TYW4_9PEZI|nr:cytochrome P450 [Microthyrium microscopicum]